MANDILTTAAANQKRAYEVIEETNILEIWTSIGAIINLVGSLRSGLLMKRRDIDFHIYTDPFSLSESFSAVARLAENPRIKSVNYANLLDAEDQCIEWHALYEDSQGNSWHIDMIHILHDSPYAGYFEHVADRIIAALTPQTRRAILTIKDAIPLDAHVMGIEIYRAVLEGGIRDPESFQQWREEHPQHGIVKWCP